MSGLAASSGPRPIAVEGGSSLHRSPYSASSRADSAVSSPSLVAFSLESDHSVHSDLFSAMEDERLSMPATPPDVSHLPQVTLSSSAGGGEGKVAQLFLSASKPARPRLVLSACDKAKFAAQIEDSKKKFVSDTAYLPKTTNMGLSEVDAAALLSVNPFNFANSVHNWEDDEVDVDRARARPPVRGGKTLFLNAFPCIYVTNLTNSLAFYQKVIGFAPVGKPASHQAVMRRGPPSRPPRGSHRPYSAIPSAAEEEGVRIVLRFLPPEWGELNGQGSGPPQLLIVVSNVDELYRDIVAQQQQFKPDGREYFPEIFLGKAKVLSKPQNTAWGTRELHILDPDGNKIIFYTELDR